MNSGSRWTASTAATRCLNSTRGRMNIKLSVLPFGTWGDFCFSSSDGGENKLRGDPQSHDTWISVVPWSKKEKKGLRACLEWICFWKSQKICQTLSTRWFYLQDICSSACCFCYYSHKLCNLSKRSFLLKVLMTLWQQHGGSLTWRSHSHWAHSSGTRGDFFFFFFKWNSNLK